MTIIEKLRHLVKTSTGYDMYYGDEQELNVKLDFALFPCAYAIALQNSTLNISTGAIKEQPTLILAFTALQQTEDSDITERTIDEMRTAAFRFLAALRRSDTIKLLRVNQAGRLYKNFDTIICGYSLNITIEEVEGFIECVGGDNVIP